MTSIKEYSYKEWMTKDNLPIWMRFNSGYNGCKVLIITNEDGISTGFLLFNKINLKINIIHIRTNPLFVRQGVATSLIKYFDRKCLLVTTCNMHNYEALCFFKKNGFKMMLPPHDVFGFGGDELSLYLTDQSVDEIVNLLVSSNNRELMKESIIRVQDIDYAVNIPVGPIAGSRTVFSSKQ